MPASSAARPTVRLLLCIAAVLAAAAGTPSAAHAQCTRNPDGTFNCPDGQEPGTDAAPVITVSPGTASLAQPAITVTVTMRDEWELVQSTFKVLRTAGGVTQDVTS